MAAGEGACACLRIWRKESLDYLSLRGEWLDLPA